MTGYPYVWQWRVTLAERYGQRCRVWARGSMYSIGVEFPDGTRTVTAQWAVTEEGGDSVGERRMQRGGAPEPPGRSAAAGPSDLGEAG